MRHIGLFLSLILISFCACKSPEENNDIGLTLYYSNDCLGAVEKFNSAINKNSEYAEAYSNRAKAKECLEDYSGAKQDFEKAIELFDLLIKSNPTGKNYWDRGMTKISSGDKKGGCLDLKEACSKNYSCKKPSLCDYN